MPEKITCHRIAINAAVSIFCSLFIHSLIFRVDFLSFFSSFSFSSPSLSYNGFFVTCLRVCVRRCVRIKLTCKQLTYASSQLKMQNQIRSCSLRFRSWTIFGWSSFRSTNQWVSQREREVSSLLAFNQHCFFQCSRLEILIDVEKEKLWLTYWSTPPPPLHLTMSRSEWKTKWKRIHWRQTACVDEPLLGHVIFLHSVLLFSDYLHFIQCLFSRFLSLSLSVEFSSNEVDHISFSRLGSR